MRKIIKAKRKELGLTQHKLAELSGVKHYVIAKFERRLCNELPPDDEEKIIHALADIAAMTETDATDKKRADNLIRRELSKSLMEHDIREVVRNKRKSLGLSQLDVSTKSGVGLQSLNKLENGKGGMGFKYLARIMTVLRLKIVDS